MLGLTSFFIHVHIYAAARIKVSFIVCICTGRRNKIHNKIRRTIGNGSNHVYPEDCLRARIGGVSVAATEISRSSMYVFTGFIHFFLNLLLLCVGKKCEPAYYGRDTILPTIIDFDGNDKLCKPISSLRFPRDSLLWYFIFRSLLFFHV